MRKGIHPTYYPEAKVSCSCGNSWTVGSTSKALRTDVCSACHPFFTGEQRIVDSEGQVDRFYQRLERREEMRRAIEERRQAAISGELPLEELELGKRTLKLLQENGYSVIADLLAAVDNEDQLLQIQGFGQKSLIDVKKRLRTGGYIE